MEIKKNEIFNAASSVSKLWNTQQTITKYTDTLKNQLKKTLTDNLSKRLLELEFKLDHSIKSKSLKWVVKKILLTI